MIEFQAQWFVAHCQGLTSLPGIDEMEQTMERDKQKSQKRFYASPRHTIQVDPIVYCDELSKTFGAKPELAKNIELIPQLIFGSCGPAQYSLQGPFKRKESKNIVKRVPMPPLSKAFYYFILILILTFPVIFSMLIMIF